MASATWRLTGLDTVGADLELSSLRLWGDASAVDVDAVMTCSHAPAAGSVDNLLDGNPITTCRWSAADVRSAGFYIQWQMPSAVDVSALKLGLVQSQTAPVALRLEWLSAGRFEVLKDYLGVVTAQAPGVLTVGDEALGSPEQGYILAAVGGTGRPQYDYNNTGGATWAQNFGQTIGLGLFASKLTNPGDTGVLPSKTINQFSVYDKLLIDCLNGSWNPDYADMDMEFLRADGSVVAAVRSRYRGAYALRMSYGSSLAALIDASYAGSYPAINGVLTFTETGMQWTPTPEAVNNNHSAWSFSAAFSEVVAVRFSQVRAFSSYGSAAAAFVTVKRSAAGARVGYTGVLPYSPTRKQSASVLLSEVQSLSQGLQATSVQRVDKLLDVEFGGAGCIYGVVEWDNLPANVPLQRRVRLHRSRDSMLVREIWSRADGFYRFDEINERYEYDVIAWDHELQFRSVVANNLVPEVTP